MPGHGGQPGPGDGSPSHPGWRLGRKGLLPSATRPHAHRTPCKHSSQHEAPPGPVGFKAPWGQQYPHPAQWVLGTQTRLHRTWCRRARVSCTRNHRLVEDNVPLSLKDGRSYSRPAGSEAGPGGRRSNLRGQTMVRTGHRPQGGARASQRKGRWPGCKEEMNEMERWGRTCPRPPPRPACCTQGTAIWGLCACWGPRKLKPLQKPRTLGSGHRGRN